MKMISFKLLDSSFWLNYFHNGFGRELIDGDENLYTSVLSLFEIKRKLLKQNEKASVINKVLRFIKLRSFIVQLSEKIVEEAAKISDEKSLHAIDSLIYTSSIFNNLTLLTFDNDFRGLKNVEVLD